MYLIQRAPKLWIGKGIGFKTQDMVVDAVSQVIIVGFILFAEISGLLQMNPSPHSNNYFTMLNRVFYKTLAVEFRQEQQFRLWPQCNVVSVGFLWYSNYDCFSDDFFAPIVTFYESKPATGWTMPLVYKQKV